jgi:D-arabinose 1-dehydrogenase-like Zn-dependent alcohol dehydrogenase
MFFDGYQVKASLVATRKAHDDMLAFAAHNSIKPKIETFELSEAGIEAAFNKLKAGSMRYRGVLVAA